MRIHLRRKTRFILESGAIWVCGIAWGGLSCALEPAPECRTYLDCGSDQTCDTQTGNCVFIGGGALGDGITGNPNSSSTDPNGTTVSRTSFVTTAPIGYIASSPDSAQPNTILFSEATSQENNAPEKVRELNAQANATRDMSIRLDLETLQLIPCGVSALHKLTQTTPAETWVSCRQANQTYIVYEGRELQGQQTLNHPSDFFLLLPTPTDGDWSRVLAGARGSSSLRSYQLRTGAGDGLGIGHPFQDEIPLAAGAVYGVWPATSDHNSVHSLVVFSRGNASANASLQFWERFSFIETWSDVISPSAFPLPAETYLVHFMEPPHLSTSDRGSDAPTMLSIETHNGSVRFWNFNGQREVFPTLKYESDSRFHFEVSSISGGSVIPLAPTKDGQYVFLAHPAGHRIWRIPTRADRVDDVRWWDAEDTTLEVASIFPVSDVELWVGYRNENRLELISFEP